MKMTDLRAKARAIFGPAFAEPMPNQPNGAKALQERANARPIPTYKVGGVVKKPTPPGPTAAEREAARRQNESLAKAKVTKKEGEVIESANRSEGGMKKGGKAGMYADGGKVMDQRVAARMAAGNYKKGGAAKKDGLAVMIAIGEPMKGMKKPVKRAVGGAGKTRKGMMK